MTKVLESMARAIGAELYGYVDPNDTPNTWASAESAARAALIALRDGVTPGMIQAAHMADPLSCDVEHAEDVYPPSFVAMIDHVLQEGEKDTEGG